MSFLKNLFSKGEQKESDRNEPIRSYDDFWNWFAANQATFHRVVKERGDIEKDFFDQVTPNLAQLHEGLFLLTGMCDPATAELIITPDGAVRNIVFAEEIIAAAPKINGWQFTALKPESGEGFSIEKGNTVVGAASLKFQSNQSWERPDEIDISIVYDGLTEQNREEVTHAAYLFLDNYLGELEFATAIDRFQVVGTNEATGEVRPIEELKSHLAERQKSFREKYEGQRANTDDDAYTMLQAELQSGLPLIAVVNTTLLKWDRKASHPWVAAIEFTYRDSGNNGMPSEQDYQLLSQIEDEILGEIKDVDGYLNIGRETSDNRRTVFFSCREFRKPSKVLNAIQQKYTDRLGVSLDIYKDKYWQTFDRFLPADDSPEFAN